MNSSDGGRWITPKHTDRAFGHTGLSFRSLLDEINQSGTENQAQFLKRPSTEDAQLSFVTKL